jgi:hypothetical protein
MGALVALLLLAGFAVAGPTGLLAWSENADALKDREAEITTLTAKRDALRNRVVLLNPEAADPDLASELVRDQPRAGAHLEELGPQLQVEARELVNRDHAGLREVDLAVCRARQVGEVERGDAEQLARALGVGGRDDRRVDPQEAALVEEAVSVGDVVRLFSFRKGQANLVELTLPDTSSCIGKTVDEIELPEDASLAAIVRDGRVLTPSATDVFVPGDELLFVASATAEGLLKDCFISQL